MSRFVIGGLAAGIGSTTLPMMSLYAAASKGGKIYEIGITNTAAVAVAVKLTRLTTTGTQGAALVEGEYDEDQDAPACTGHNTHTVNPTLVSFEQVFQLGAAIGSAVIWTFGDSGLVIKPGTGNGIGVILAGGTGQVCYIYFKWRE